jgi:hypothetical protein
MGDDMTNQEAIRTTKEFIADLEASDVPIYANEREALEKLIQTAREYDALIASDKNYTYEDLINMTLRER